MKPIVYIPAFIIIATLSAFIGSYYGYQNGVQSVETVATTTDVKEAPASDAAPAAPQAQPAPSISPEDLAKAKGVPAMLKNPQGDFTLVAVVEGAAANRKLTQSLQLVGSQRQRLANLSQQHQQTPADSTQQKELLAGQINELRKTLETNLRFMSQNFAYSLNYNYTLVPHEASLLAVTQVEGKAKTELVHEFKTAASYEECQQKRQAYVSLKQEQAKAAQEAATATATPPPAVPEDTATPPAPLPAPKPQPTPEMEKLRAELIKLYNFNPDKPHQVDFTKTAIYARRVR